MDDAVNARKNECKAETRADTRERAVKSGAVCEHGGGTASGEGCVYLPLHSPLLKPRCSNWFICLPFVHTGFHSIPFQEEQRVTRGRGENNLSGEESEGFTPSTQSSAQSTETVRSPPTTPLPVRKSRRLAGPGEEPATSYTEPPSPSTRLNNPPVVDLKSLKKYILRTGKKNGADDCLWADDFAFGVIAEALSLSIYFIDMEREGDANPYRMLAAPAEGGAERFILLVRESNSHFNYISYASPGGVEDGSWKLEEGPGAVRALFGL